jgi:amino-acid N-acetyltransferase
MPDKSLVNPRNVKGGNLRYARSSDIDKIQKLLEPFAKQGILLNKDRKKIESDLPGTVVYCVDDEILGVANLYQYDPNLFEIRGLAIDLNYQKTGIGKKIIEKLLIDLKIEFANQTITVFALTLASEFFVKIGWQSVKKEKFPRKIFDDCAYCIKKDDCFEEAVEIVVNGDV